MQITLNGQRISTLQTTLDGLLIEQGFEDCSVATAIDQQFVPQTERAHTTLHDDCVVEVVAPMQGG